MSGPGLKHVDSHSAIHEAALTEAMELNELLERLLLDDRKEQALEVAYVGVEHWETRTLRHAKEEEEGLYRELLEEYPEMKDQITALTRDHELLGLLIEEIKELLDTEGASAEVLTRFQSLVHVDLLHNQAEERILPER
ncbi:hemerythrin domain-containing protein [Virgibacillus xinjiangensis]|uniref:Hemerythrin domain-containing protein n=1 Tax=Virgibacillus xinjiangensis TaxID=393090 RepID=A0ABV7CVY8_9BACI